MLTKNEIKYIQSLYHKKQRNEDKVFVAEGPKLAEELLQSHFIVRHVYATGTWLSKHKNIQIPVTEVSDIELSRISNQETPNEVLVIALQAEHKIEPVIKSMFSIVLDGIRDPGNLGTIVRIADWFGIQQIICSSDCADLYNPKVVQATMGSITRVQCWYKDFAEWNTEPAPEIYGAVLNGQNIYELPPTREGLLVIGNESKGIREPMLSKITQPVTIPKVGAAESLNAAVATGILASWLVGSVKL